MNIVHTIISQLPSSYPKEEARAIAFLLLEHYFGLSKTDLAAGRQPPENYPEVLRPALDRLRQQEPVQYVLGSTEFYGRTFNVTPDVLIPRPETEALADLIISENKGKHPLHILDIGTGSGCIAVTLAKELEATVRAIDISEEALAVARENARLAGARVAFEQADILSRQPGKEQFHVIVSNPPYVTETDKQQMQANVLDYEPPGALFVPDDDPLVFYKAIATYAAAALVPAGRLYLEINERYGAETGAVVAGSGFRDVRVVQDLRGKDRIVVAHRI